MNLLKVILLWILGTVTFVLTIAVLFSISNNRLATNEPFNLKLTNDHYFIPVNPFCYYCRDYSIQLSRKIDVETQLNNLIKDTCFKPWTKFKGTYFESPNKSNHPGYIPKDNSVKIIDYEGYSTSCCTLDKKLMRTRLIDLQLNTENMRLDGYYRGFDRECFTGWMR